MLHWSIFLLLQALLLFSKTLANTRYNYCHQRDGLRNGSLKLSLALAGTHPEIAYTANAAVAYFQSDPNTLLPINGFLYQLFERMAISGNFRWNYTLTPNQKSTVKDDGYLKNITSQYETVTKVSFDTTQRRKLGMDFTPPLLSANLVMIVDKNKGKQSIDFDAYSFLYPFNYEVWGAIIAAIMAHAIIQFLIDYSEYRRAGIAEQALEVEDPTQVADPLHHPPLKFEEYVFQSYGTYTTISTFEPIKRSGKAVYLLFSFFISILLASYIAILASHLSGKATLVLPITTMYDANKQGAKVCFRKGGAAIALTTQLYPNIQVVETLKTSNNEVLDFLNAGKCQAAVLAYNDWQVVSVSISNKGCNLAVSGPIVRQMNVALPFKVDLNERCTSTFGQAFSQLMTLMSEQFVIQQLWADTLNHIKVVDCSNPSAPPTNSALDFDSMFGVFYFYYVTAGIIIVLHVLGVCIDSADKMRLARLKEQGRQTFSQRASIKAQSISKRLSVAVLRKGTNNEEQDDSSYGASLGDYEASSKFENKRNAIVRSCGLLLLEVTNKKRTPETLLSAIDEASKVDEIISETLTKHEY